ncbi:MAG: hypothetical protein KatS3mg050_3944 [Litorilinea sp.]|nr:MAG: hypothetical protein KatS3mg050_3944 [Litorilinea sp.]
MQLVSQRSFSPSAPYAQKSSPASRWSQATTAPSTAAPALPLPSGWLSPLLRQMDVAAGWLRLPDSPQAFARYVAGLSLIFLGLTLHVLLAAQILQARVELSQLQAQHERLIQENSELAWQIAAATNLDRIAQRARELGYVPAEGRTFVVLPATPAAPAIPAPVAEPQPEKTQAEGGLLHWLQTLLAPDSNSREPLALPTPASPAADEAPFGWWTRWWPRQPVQE